MVGSKVEVFQPGDDLWQTGRIERYYPGKGWLVQYYDGDSTWLQSLENVQIMRNDGDDDGDGISDNGASSYGGSDEEEYGDDEFEVPSPVRAERDALRDLIDGVDSELNEFDEYLLSHPHGDETLRELARLELSAGICVGESIVAREEIGSKLGDDDHEIQDAAIDSDEDEDLEHMPTEEHNAVIEIRILEINDMITPASGTQKCMANLPSAERIINKTRILCGWYRHSKPSSSDIVRRNSTRTECGRLSLSV